MYVETESNVEHRDEEDISAVFIPQKTVLVPRNGKIVLPCLTQKKQRKVRRHR